MTEKQCLFACSNFSREIAAAVTAEGWNDVEVVTLPAGCGRLPIAWDVLRPRLPDGCTQIAILGSACLAGLADPPADFPPTRIVQVPQCFYLVAGQNLVDETIMSGGYLITPVWLADWREHLSEMGFKPEYAVEFFRDFAKELVFLDTGIDRVYLPDFAELLETVELPGRRIPIGLDHLRLFLTKLVMECRFERDQRTVKERERLNAIKLADQVSAMDMLMRLSSIQNEDESIEAIKELFHMLFAPTALYYLKVEGETPISKQAIPAEIQASMLGLHNDYALTPDSRGFQLSIKHGDNLLGVIAIEELAFPEYSQRYLNMALAITGVFALVVKNARDATELKRAEEAKLALEKQLIQTQKLESLGVLAGGIAHDFNNILMIITGRCDLAEMDPENKGVHIPEIAKAASRAAALCRQMLAYAGKTQLTMSHVSMLVLVDEMVAMLKSTLPQNIVLKPDLSTNIPSIKGDASQLRQVVMNLIINASEAIGTEQGEIKILLNQATVRAGQTDRDCQGKAILPGGYICLEVTDNGCGMDEETEWRIFEPFYTTKFAGRGLGMSAVLGIINSHSGAIQLFSQPGQGTTFKIYLPTQKSDATGDEKPKQSVPTAAWQGSGTILLVEDEDPVRFIIKNLLENFGFTVLEAVNGKEALELFRENASGVTMVLTDIGMPVMDGYELFFKLRKLNPELPVIISSGFSYAEIISRINADDISGFISKPYNLNELMDVLRNVSEGIPKGARAA